MKKTKTYLLTKIFAKRLIELRKNHHLSQYKLADEIGMSRSVIAYYETYARNPTLEVLQRISEYFQVSPESLIVEENKPSFLKNNPSKLEKQIQEIRKLPKSKQKMISNMLEGALL